MEANVSHLVYGQSLQVKGTIDTTLSRTPVKDYKVVLREITTKVSSCGHVRRFSKDFVLYSAEKVLEEGRSDSFEATVGIPQQVTGYTAIGNILCRAYYLALVAQVSCCYSNPTLLIHTVLTTSLEPEVCEEEQM
jgi:hypothetical protein